MVLGIYGGGGLGREILGLANTINLKNKKWEQIIFIDDISNQCEIKGAKVLKFEEIIKIYKASEIEIIVALGEPKFRFDLRQRVNTHGYNLATLIHPNVNIGSDTTIQEGAIICYGCFISCDVKIGYNVLIQPNVTIGHDSTIKSDSVVTSNTFIAGSCTVSEQTFISANVSIREKTTIGSDTIVGMGSVVCRNIPNDVIILGNPAKIISQNEEHRVFR